MIRLCEEDTVAFKFCMPVEATVTRKAGVVALLKNWAYREVSC